MLSFLRRNKDETSELAVILNLTPVPRLGYRVGLPRPGRWREVLNSDAAAYGGSNVGNMGGVTAQEQKWHNQPCSAEFVLPPLGIVAFQPETPKVAEPLEPPEDPEPLDKAEESPAAPTEDEAAE